MQSSESNYPNRLKNNFKSLKGNATFALGRASNWHAPVWCSFKKVIPSLLLKLRAWLEGKDTFVNLHLVGVKHMQRFYYIFQPTQNHRCWLHIPPSSKLLDLPCGCLQVNWPIFGHVLTYKGVQIDAGDQP